MDALPDFFPLASTQRDIWVDQQIDPASPRYNIGGYILIEGLADADRFARAAKRVFEGSDCLRMRVTVRDGVAVQSFDAEWPGVAVVDFSAAADGDAAALRWMQHAFVSPIDLARDAYFEFALIRARPDRYYWFKKYHHLATDGW